MISALLTAGYLLPIVTNAFFPGEEIDLSNIIKQQDSWLMWVTICLLTTLVVLLGIFPDTLSAGILFVVNRLFP